MKVALQNTALFAFLVISLAYVGPRIDEAQAQEDAAIEAQNQAQQEQALRQQLQALCGGPEATVIDKPTGGHDCYDTNGRKTKTIPGLARPVSTKNSAATRTLGVRMSRDAECANSTESAGLVPAGFI